MPRLDTIGRRVTRVYTITHHHPRVFPFGRYYTDRYGRKQWKCLVCQRERSRRARA